MGATDGQITALANNQIDLQSLHEELADGLPSAGETSGTVPYFGAPSSLTDTQQADVNDVSNQTGLDPTDEASWYEITARLQALNNEIKGLAQLSQRDGSVNALCGGAIAQLRRDYKEIVQPWTSAYSVVFGTRPGGLSALGVTSINPQRVAALIPTFVFVAAHTAALETNYSKVNAQAQAKLDANQDLLSHISGGLTLQSNRHQSFTEMQSAQASGNTARAADAAQTLAGMGDSSVPPHFTDANGSTVWLQVTDPATIAQLQNNAIQAGVDPSVVTQLINSGADRVQIQLALNMGTTSTLQANQDIVSELTAGSGSDDSGGDPSSSLLGGIPSWALIAGGLVLAATVAPALIKKF